jgi:hypothetical protein
MRDDTASQTRAVLTVKENALLAGTALRALIPAKEPDLATRAGTVLQALPLRMAVLGVSAAQARTPRRAQERHKLAHPVMQAGTALRARIPAKEPGLAMRGFTASQARAVRFKYNALLAGTALRALIPAKEPGRAMRAGTALRA